MHAILLSNIARGEDKGVVMKFERATGIHLTAIADLYGFKRKWFEKIPWLGDWLLRRRTLKGWRDMGERAAREFQAAWWK